MLSPIQTVLEDLFAKDSSDIDSGYLEKLLGVTRKDLAVALNMNPTALSKEPSIAPTHQTIKNWLVIFNLFIGYVQQSEPNLTKEQIQVKMSRWLKLPNTQLGNLSPLDVMMKGKARKVIHLLEQLSQ